MHDARQIAALLGGKAHGRQIRAPGPGHSKKDRSLAVTINPDAPFGLLVNSFADDPATCFAYVRDALGLDRCAPERRTISRKAKPPGTGPEDDEVGHSHDKARWLWSQSWPITGTAAENYLREQRGYHGPIPPTLRFLPARDPHPPAMIAALRIGGGTVRAVHLTKLAADGAGKAGTDADKIMIGRAVTAPISLAPINDMLSLAITEGIEDGLSAFAALGIGTWAAGSACRLPGLADHVAGYIETVTILEDDDEAGRRFAGELARLLLQRRIEVRRVNLTRRVAVTS